MGLINASSGTWWTHSDTDPRWNHSESGTLYGAFDHSSARSWATAMIPVLGEWPDDLTFHTMKD